jgi:hypothetical protein
MTFVLFDVTSELGAVGITAVVGFFLVFAAVAYIAFRLLKRTVRMALRMAIVAAILVVALAGSVLIYWKRTSSTTTHPRPVPTRSR